MRLSLILLPVWIFGCGELARFAWNNTLEGPFERNGSVKGRDFVQFYVQGTLAREGDWLSIYDPARLERAVARIVPAAAGQIPAPLYGPQVPLSFSPLARLRYLYARWLWCGVSVVLYLLASALVVRRLPALRTCSPLVWLTILCNPALSMLLSTGQTGAIATVIWTGACLALLQGSEFRMGACLGLLVYKPSLLVGIVPAVAVAAEWRVLAGVTVSAIAQCAVTGLIGAGPWMAYFDALRNARAYFYLTDTVPHQKQSLAGFFELLGGLGAVTTTLTLMAAIVLLGVWWRIRGRAREPHVFLPMLAVTSILLSPHLYVYDLVLLTAPLLVLANHLVSEVPAAGRALAAWSGLAVILAPFSGVLARSTHLQLSTIALVVLVVALQRMCSESRGLRGGSGLLSGSFSASPLR